MNKLFDLRFVIGVFFLIVGFLLLIYSFLSGDPTEGAHKVNLWCGSLFIIFALIMILPSLKKSKVDDTIGDNPENL